MVVKTRKVDLRKTLEARRDVLNLMRNCLTCFVGQMGTGKTTNAVAIAHWMSALFEKPVVQVGTNMGLTEKFGPYTHLTPRQFIEQLVLIGTIATEIAEQKIQDQQAYIDHAKQHRGLILHDCIVVVDEIQNFCHPRQHNSPVNLAFQAFIDEMRHFMVTMISMAPSADKIDRNVRQQVRWWCEPDYHPYTKWYTLWMHGKQGKLKLDMYAPSFRGMFDSWSLTGFDVKRLEKVLDKYV